MIFLIFWILCGVFSASIAGGKGHGGCSWFLGGLLFGPIALIATLGLRDRKRDSDTQRLLLTQEEMLDEMQRKHAWERRQWEQEQERQYLEAESRRREEYLLPGEEEGYEDELDEADDDYIDVSASTADSLEDYLHELESEEAVPDLLEKLNALGMETKAEFLYRLKWDVQISEDQEPEELFAEHMWKEVLNKPDGSEYKEFWDKELSESFLVIKTPEYAYFLKRNHG